MQIRISKLTRTKISQPGEKRKLSPLVFVTHSLMLCKDIRESTNLHHRKVPYRVKAFFFTHLDLLPDPFTEVR